MYHGITLNFTNHYNIINVIVCDSINTTDIKPLTGLVYDFIINYPLIKSAILNEMNKISLIDNDVKYCYTDIKIVNEKMLIDATVIEYC